MNPEKPGYQTTEFWLTLVSQVIPVLLLTGALSAEDATKVQDGLSNAIVTGFAFVQAFVSVVMYIYSRARVKAAVLTPQAPDITATVNN